MFAIRHQFTWGGKTWYKASSWSEILVKTSCIYLTSRHRQDRRWEAKLRTGRQHSACFHVYSKKKETNVIFPQSSLFFVFSVILIVSSCNYCTVYFTHVCLSSVTTKSRQISLFFKKYCSFPFPAPPLSLFSPRLLSLFSLFLQSRSPSHWLHFQSIICGVACNCSLILTPLMQQVES